MFKIPSLVKLPKHRQFDYIPRYYNPEKEEIQERLAERRALKGVANQNDENIEKSEENRQDRLTMAFREARRNRQIYKTSDKKSVVLRLVLIVFFMVCFTLWFFAGEAVTNFIISGDNRTTFPLILASIFGAIVIKNVLNFKR